MVTLADIAAVCGMSPSTVSRALSDPDKVNAHSRQRIQRAARELGYIPPHTATRARSRRSDLPRARTGTLGLIVPDIANPFFPPIIKAVQARAHRRDLAVLLADTDESAADELPQAHLMEKQVDGLILVSPRTPQAKLIELHPPGPVVLINRRVDGFACVVIENSLGIDQAVEHLTALGHRRICYLNGPRRSWSNQWRQQAITTACKTYSAELTQLGPFEPHIEAGVRAADLLRASHATAVIAYDDLIALGVMARLAEYGLRVGQDISVVGIDDSPMSGVSYPTLTTIHVPGAQAGTTAVDLIIDLTDNTHHDTPPVIELETRLVIRNSTGPAPTPQNP